MALWLRTHSSGSTWTMGTGRWLLAHVSLSDAHLMAGSVHGYRAVLWGWGNPPEGNICSMQVRQEQTDPEGHPQLSVRVLHEPNRGVLHH